MKKSEALILAIESSCDDTSVAILKGFEVLANVIFSQDVHSYYGGVVPEMASRAHIESIVPTIKTSLKASNINLNQIEAIAVTQGPGLLGSLLVGHSIAKSLALALSIPMINVHHLEGHMLSCFLTERNIQQKSNLDFPYLCLTVSGGHTQIVIVHNWNKFEIIGQTLDDAVGEAFDKVAKILELGYPGGPKIELLAREGDPEAFNFPRPMTDKDNLDFSFSGLKTAVFYEFKKISKASDNQKADIAASFQAAVADTLLWKCQKALRLTGLTELVIGGGVASNKNIREKLINGLTDKKIFFPPIERCTDNGAMIAYAGSFYLGKNKLDNGLEIKPRWPLSELDYG